MAERPCDCGMLCLRPKSSLCSCRQLLHVRPALHRTCLFREVGVFEEVDHFEREFQTEGGVAHQPLLVSEN